METEPGVVRPLSVDDIEPLRALAREIWELHYTPIIGSAQIQYMLDQRYRAEVIRRELARGNLWWDLLEVGGVPRGYSSYFVDGAGDVLKLDKLYVHPHCHRQGHGERMLTRVIEQARVQGCGRVSLAVNKRNSQAIAAYERWSFRVTQAIVQDIGEGFVMDDYIMVREV